VPNITDDRDDTASENDTRKKDTESKNELEDVFDKEVSEDDEDLEDEETQQNKIKKSTVKYFIDLGLVITFTTTFVTGIIKFSPLTNLFGVNQRTLPMLQISLLHDFGAIIMGFLILGHLFLNWSWFANKTKKGCRKIDKGKLATKLLAAFIVLIILALILQSPEVQRLLFFPDNAIMIDGVGQFEYSSKEITSMRPDIFTEGHFSVFDILAYLDNQSKIDMNYHFDDTMNTYVIDDINGKENWWYMAYYDGGWPEDNVFRMDHYPYKDKMYIRMERESEDTLNKYHDIFRSEVERKSRDDGKVLIGSVIIRGTRDELIFHDVKVTPHNLRYDTLVNGTVTAIDVIMSLGDAGLITYELQWYNTVGTATVKNYFVQKINDDELEGRCGFVYEAGSYNYSGFRGNHIHIPPDIRVINSPEYVEYFWICI